MKSQIHSFPLFLNAIQNHELAYLFGTGISASLTGKPYSWWKWIMDGISYMKDTALAKQYQESLEADDSTGNMIAIVGKIIDAVKAGHTYGCWMQEAFETNPIVNKPLAGTLKKLVIPQDVFVTTNYDLLLEQATGLGTLSYEDPGEAFHMLDQKCSTHILHIHGVYDSSKGIDNIVADQAQYEAVLGNEGAQFIQHILGTRTLIFVGCGKTTEDMNMAKFIQFAKNHLKMDQDYYFLYKNGQSFDGMPDNIKLIPYGDEYADLPAFLEDMAQERLRYIAEKNKIVGKTGVQGRKPFTDPLMKYHYSQESIPFGGRKEELQKLWDFIEYGDSICWWAVTGQAGAGKSRLALQMLKQLPCTWFGFFLNDKASLSDVRNFQPFSHTAIVIDYVGGREDAVAEIMEALSQVFSSTSYFFRILLLERENSRKTGSWHSKLMRRLGKYHKVATAEYKKEFLDIGDLDIWSVESFIGAVCQAKGLPADKARDCRLREIYGEKFENLQFRPLFVQIFVESWIENGFSFPRFDTFEDLLQFLLHREQERWLALLDGDQGCCNSFVHLLLRANITGELNIRELPCLYQPDWEKISRFLSEHSFPGRQRMEEAKAIINSVCQNMDKDNGAIIPLFPDIIKEYMFYYYMDEERLPAVMNEIWQNAAHDFSLFITRCMTDFPENGFFRQALNKYEEETTDVYILKGRLEMLQKRIINDNDDPVVLLNIIDNEYGFWKGVAIPQDGSEQSDLLAALKVSGLNMVARQYGGWSVYDVSQILEVIDEALSVPGGRGAQLVKQVCLQEHIRQLSHTGFLDAAAGLEEKMSSLIEKDAQDDWNSSLDMINQNAIMMNHLLAGDIYQAAMVFKQMAIKCSYKSKEAIRVFAHSCINISHFAFLLQKTKYRHTGLAAAEKLSLLFPDDEMVQIRLLGCQAMELQWQYFVDETMAKPDLKKSLDELDPILGKIPFENTEKNEALDMTWGIVKTLQINAVSEDKEGLEIIIREAYGILSQYPELACILTTLIKAVHALHKNVFKDKVSHKEVEELFRFVEYNHTSGTAREAFFHLLEDSEDKRRRQDYLTKWVKVGALQDARYSPYGSGLEEFDEQEELLRMAADLSPQETYRRAGPKVGANDPCPCGSGKKFKKCCRGKGIYD